jgi:hypothetical protein
MFSAGKPGASAYQGSGVEEITLGLPIEARQLAIWHPADAELNPLIMEMIRKCRTFLASQLAKVST